MRVAGGRRSAFQSAEVVALCEIVATHIHMHIYIYEICINLFAFLCLNMLPQSNGIYLSLISLSLYQRGRQTALPTTSPHERFALTLCIVIFLTSFMCLYACTYMP